MPPRATPRAPPNVARALAAPPGEHLEAPVDEHEAGAQQRRPTRARPSAAATTAASDDRRDEDERCNSLSAAQPRPPGLSLLRLQVDRVQRQGEPGEHADHREQREHADDPVDAGPDAETDGDAGQQQERDRLGRRRRTTLAVVPPVTCRCGVTLYLPRSARCPQQPSTVARTDEHVAAATERRRGDHGVIPASSSSPRRLAASGAWGGRAIGPAAAPGAVAAEQPRHVGGGDDGGAPRARWSPAVLARCMAMARPLSSRHHV